MLKKFIFPLAIVSSSVFAQNTTTTAPDPLQQILDKLDSMEKRLDNLENTNQATQSQPTSNTSSPTPPAQTSKTAISPAPQKDELVGGMVIKIKHGDPKKQQWLTEGISTEHFAGYVTTSSEITTTDIYKKTLGYTGAYALAVEGYFNATEKGTYNFGVMHQKLKKSWSAPRCRSNISLNGTALAESTEKLKKNDRENINMLVNGSVTLEPGIYEYAIFSACEDHERYHEMKRTFLVKTPSDLSMRPITEKDILHKK